MIQEPLNRLLSVAMAKVAFGATQTSTGKPNQLDRSQMTRCRHPMARSASRRLIQTRPKAIDSLMEVNVPKTRNFASCACARGCVATKRRDASVRCKSRLRQLRQAEVDS